MKIKRLNEICDSLEYKEIKIDYSYGYPFFYDSTNVILGEYGDAHSDSFGYDEDRRYMDEGRIWLKKDLIGTELEGFNVMAFWSYPLKENFVDFLKLFEKDTGIEIFNDNWLVEVNYTEEYENKCLYVDKDEDYCLIKLKDYIGSENPSEEKKLWHLMKVDDRRRKKRKKPETFGSKSDKRPLKWKQALLKSESKIFENPNCIYYDGDEIEWVKTSTIVFSYYRNQEGEDEMFVQENWTHRVLYNYLFDEDIVEFDRKVSRNNGRGKYSGRIFLEEKIITFWHFPEDWEKLKKVVKDIEEKIDFTILNSGFNIEVIKDEKYVEKNWGSWNPEEDDNTEIIPLEDYRGLGKEVYQKGIEIPHLKDWRKKYKESKPETFGSKADKRPLKWKQALMKSEGKIFESPDVLGQFPVFFTTEGAYPFLVTQEDDFYIGEETRSHLSILKEILYDTSLLDDHFYEYFGYEKDNDTDEESILDFLIDFTDKVEIDTMTKYSGRIFTKQKVISFWTYPDIRDLKKIVKDLEYELDIEIWEDPEYKIDVLTNAELKNYELIPIKNYKKGIDNLEGWKYHLMDSLDPRRKLREKPETFGSKADKRPLKWKQALMKSEGKIITFSEYLKETRGYPDSIDPIFNLLEEVCYEHFANYDGEPAYNIQEKIEWDEIENYIDKETWINFPVENINIIFTISIDDEESEIESYQSGYIDYNNESELSSKIIDSETDLIDKSISLSLFIGLILPDTENYDKELYKKYIRYSLKHELTHTYQDYKQNLRKLPLYNVWQNVYSIATQYDFISQSDSFIQLFYLLYSTDKLELNADLATTKEEKSRINLVIEDIKQFVDNFDEVYNLFINDVKELEDYQHILNNFGKFFVGVYLQGCEEVDKEPLKKIVNLYDKDLKGVLDFCKKLFRKKLNYINKKSKRI